MGTLRPHAPQILPCKLEYRYLWVPYAPTCRRSCRVSWSIPIYGTLRPHVPQILPCKLEQKVQDLIELICNVKAMEEAVMEMQYDAKKAPLGGYQGNHPGDDLPATALRSVLSYFLVSGDISLLDHLLKGKYLSTLFNFLSVLTSNKRGIKLSALQFQNEQNAFFPTSTLLSITCRLQLVTHLINVLGIFCVFRYVLSNSVPAFVFLCVPQRPFYLSRSFSCQVLFRNTKALSRGMIN